MGKLRNRTLHCRLTGTDLRPSHYLLVTTRGSFFTKQGSLVNDDVKAITRTNGSWDGEPFPILVTIHLDGQGSVDEITKDPS